MQPKISIRWPLLIVGIVGIAVFSAIVFSPDKTSAPALTIKDEFGVPMSYRANIISATEENENFRRVLFTGSKSQLVMMSIPPGGEVGEETHKYTEQTLFFLSGTGEGAFNNEKFPIGPGDVVVVTAGTKHNFWNTGAQFLKIYTVYAPPNHIDGRVHRTKEDADADAADEAVGETMPLE
jgi:mannose-6-phosphate isomerase-like protein (cupin superfamily)